MAMRHPLRVGVIGVGSMGFHHARNYAELTQANLVAVMDTDAARAQQVAERFECNAYTDYCAMLEHEQLDAVSIAVPTKFHHTVAMTTLNAGVHTLVEKPIAHNIAEARDLIEAARAHNAVLQVGHVERFNPAVQELKRRLKANELGNISSIIARRVGVMPPRVKDVDVVVDLAVHDIDIAMYLLDQEPTSVAATASAALLSNNRNDHSEIFLKFGTIGCYIQANWITPIKIRTLSVTGDAGHAELNYVTQRLDIFQSNLERKHDDFGDFVVRFGMPQAIAADITPQEPLRLELKSFLTNIQTHTPALVTGEDGLRALAVVERIKQTLNEQHQPVAWAGMWSVA